MQRQGQGEPLVMLHGWGMHSDVWHALGDTLAEHFSVLRIDLPGHGGSTMACTLELDAVSQEILSQVPEQCHWLGWSLGASVVMNIRALAPQRVLSMALIAASPRFVRGADWLHGIDAALLQQFGRELEQNHGKTLRRFIALQGLHSQSAAATLKQLREQLFAAAEPHIDALRQGLNILLQADLRETLQRNSSACMVILGERDQLVPASVAEYYKALPQPARVRSVDGAGHAPFLSHPEEVTAALLGFLRAQTGGGSA